MLTDCWHIHIKQHTHRFLGTPHGVIFIVDLNTLFLSFYLEYKELSCAISYFSTLCHILLISLA